MRRPPLLPWEPTYARPVLLDEHRDHLRTSGLSDETIANVGLCSIDEPQADALGYAAGVAGLCFPYPDCPIRVGGRQVPYTRLRVDASRVRNPGQKYENPLKGRIDEGAPFYPYVPRTVHALRKDISAPIVVTEGEKKALKLTQESFPAIGLPGVHMFAEPGASAPSGSKPLHAVLRGWSWPHRTAFVCFDSDRVEKDGVSLAQERLCRALTKEGARVHVVELPRLEGMAKTGADDFLLARGAKAFRALIVAAREWMPGGLLLDLVPPDLPPDALRVAMERLSRRICELSLEERRELVEPLRRRHPRCSRAEVERILLLGGAPDDGSRPAIYVRGRQTREIVADAWGALLAGNGGSVLRHGEGLVYVPPAGDTPRHRQQRALDGDLLTALLNRRADWIIEGKDGPRHARLPPEVVRDMLAMPDRSVPVLNGVSRVPVARADGSVVTSDGFDPVTGLFHIADPEVVAAFGPDRTGVGDLGEARRWIVDELLGDFPFERPSQRAHAVGAFLLPFVRHLIRGPTPLQLIEAPTEGTGKDLLADVIGKVSLGSAPPATPLGGSEEEVRKALTAALRDAPAMVRFGNVARPVDSPALAAVLTSQTWSDRLLGESRTVALPNTAIWIMTANNPVVSREIARRTVRIRLDAGLERPHLRGDFRHRNLGGWVSEHRADLVLAALTVVRSWLLTGGRPGRTRLGSFEAWSETVGGLLDHLGVPDFLGGREEDHPGITDDGGEWRGFVEVWAERHGEEPVLAAALLDLAGVHGYFDLDCSSARERRTRAWFGHQLQRARGRRYGPYCIRVGRDAHLKQVTYALIRVEVESGSTRVHPQEPGDPGDR